MNSQNTPLEGFHILGIKIRTTNAEEMKGAGKIQAVWGKFFAEQWMTKIPGTVDRNILGVYHDYESDANGAYSVLVGMKVAAGTPVPAGLELLKIPSQNYMKLTTKKGEMPGIVVETWQQVWTMEARSELKRAYTFDLEIYDERAANPMDSQVDLYIAIK